MIMREEMDVAKGKAKYRMGKDKYSSGQREKWRDTLEGKRHIVKGVERERILSRDP